MLIEEFQTIKIETNIIRTQKSRYFTFIFVDEVHYFMDFRESVHSPCLICKSFSLKGGKRELDVGVS